jgi:hypothetical protein
VISNHEDRVRGTPGKETQARGTRHTQESQDEERDTEMPSHRRGMTTLSRVYIDTGATSEVDDRRWNREANVDAEMLTGVKTGMQERKLERREGEQDSRGTTG